MRRLKIFNKWLIPTLIGILMILSGCEDNLEEQPRSIVDPASFYKSADQINLVLAHCIDNFYGYWSGQFPWVNRTTFQHTDQERHGHLVIAENTGSSMWRSHYNAIMNLNYVIKAIKDGNVENESQETLDDLMGMARCLRGWNYHYLVQMFGDVPVILEDTEDYFSVQLSRTPVKDVYDLIVSDYTYAISTLPANPGQVGHPNLDVAKALLAKAYLCMASAPLNDASYWSKARDMAWEVIQAGRYSLVEDINDVFSIATEEGPEMMWSFIANTKDRAIHPQCWSTMHGWGDIGVEIPWAERFPEQPRKEAYLELYNMSGKHYTEINSYPGVKKMLYAADISTGMSTVNSPVIRYADVLLMYAEAANMANGGPTPEAVWAVNEIIDRANGYEENPDYPLATIDMSKEDFDELVIDERNWELCFELADRWFDLIRKRILLKYAWEADKKNFTEDDYLFPIPEQDSRVNPNLTQNPGYPTYN